jgi:hypothetical protein
MRRATEQHIDATLAPMRQVPCRSVFQRFWFRASILTLLALVGAKNADAQLSATTNNNVTVSQGSILYINGTPIMPQLNFAVSGGETTCDTLSWTISIDWTAPSGQQTSTTFNGQFACNQTATVDWSSVGFAGGTAALSWTDDCGDAGNLSFSILGTNPPPSAVDSLTSTSSPPWFWLNILAWESQAWHASPTGIYHQFTSSGVPLNCNCPNGIGLTQLDPVSGGTFPNGNNDFWSWSVNEVDGYNLLVSKQSAASTNWNAELADMLNNNGGQPSWAHWSQGVCTFDASPPSGVPAAGAHSFADANWLKNYNGNYFIFWDPPANGNPGFWDINSAGLTTYVPNVCSSPAI